MGFEQIFKGWKWKPTCQGSKYNKSCPIASEKVRWSLQTTRCHLAKKQHYFQFFTRFGKCNKEGGKCPYIHD